MSKREDATITLPEFALRAGLSYADAYNAVLTRRVRGEREGARWRVNRADAEKFARQRAESPALAGTAA
jgi:hypothetical protein